MPSIEGTSSHASQLLASEEEETLIQASSETTHETEGTQAHGADDSDSEIRPTVNWGSLESLPPGFDYVHVSNASEDDTGMTSEQKAMKRSYKNALEERTRQNEAEGKIFAKTRARIGLHVRSRSITKAGVVEHGFNRGLEQQRDAAKVATPVDEIQRSHINDMERRKKDKDKQGQG
jgi:hypothetical protein